MKRNYATAFPEMNDLDEFECALGLDQHYLEIPIALRCGHAACRSCLQEITGIMKCKMCNQLVDETAINAQESSFIRKAIERTLHHLLADIEHKSVFVLKSLKGQYNVSFQLFKNK